MAVSKRVGSGAYQYELVENWPKVEIAGGIADVTCDASGRVYAGVRNRQADGKPGNILRGDGHVLVLDRDGNVVDTWEHKAGSPHGIWITPSGELFLADTVTHTITKHAPSGEVLLTLGTPGKTGQPGAPFNMPTHAVEAPNGDIFVSDGYGQNRIHRFSAKGEHILSFGSGDGVFIPRRFGIGDTGGTPGTGPGQFNVPHDVYVDRDSHVYVLDRENNRWQVFTADGEQISICDGLDHPNKILLDADGNFNMVGAGGVEIRQPDGTFVARWGEKGSDPGQFIATVHGGWIDDQGAIYTAEAGFISRLQKFVRV
jgi:DNA-binding beta-propeller fold protein YncE